MADFRQLALEFVLADEETKLNNLSKQASLEIQNAPTNSNPIARWVESVQPWMPGSGEDDVQAEQDTPDWTSRAKALDFLSRTLDHMDKGLLKLSQVKLLISFFGAMFDVDHKAGVMASATALTHIVGMRAFPSSSGRDVIDKLCVLGEDFSRQTVPTRLAVYRLLQLLLSDARTAKELPNTHGTSDVVSTLVRLCSNERDPDCLMLWFGVLRQILSQTELSEPQVDGIYQCFKSYFPITLPRTAQSQITPNELKSQLRACFSSNHRLAPLVFPFLIGKLDLGDGVTVNVKLDILRTMKACVENFASPDESVVPFIDQIWTSLKYEVRNGEIEDTIQATIDVLRTLANKIEGRQFDMYASMVLETSISDLQNPAYTAQAGRLVLGVLGTSSKSFAYMAYKVLRTIRDELSRPQSTSHAQDHIKLLHVLLITRRTLLAQSSDSTEQLNLASSDLILQTLYPDHLKLHLQVGKIASITTDDIKFTAMTLECAGELVAQTTATNTTQSQPITGHSRRLLMSHSLCSEICQDLFAVLKEVLKGDTSNVNRTPLKVAVTAALSRAVHAFPDGFEPLVHNIVSVVQKHLSNPIDDAADLMQVLGTSISFIGLSKLPNPPARGLEHYILYLTTLKEQLFTLLGVKGHPSLLLALTTVMWASANIFNDACKAENPVKDVFSLPESWQTSITARYPTVTGKGLPLQALDTNESMLETSHSQQTSVAPEQSSKDVGQIRDDSLFITLSIIQQLLNRFLRPASINVKRHVLSLNDELAASREGVDSFRVLSELAGFVVHEISEAQQIGAGIADQVVNLFHQDGATTSSNQQSQGATVESDTTLSNDLDWSWLLFEDVGLLAAGILRNLRPAAIKKLFDTGVAQQLLKTTTPHSLRTEMISPSAPIWDIYSTLVNRGDFALSEPLIEDLVQQSSTLLSRDEPLKGKSLESATVSITSLCAVAAGLVRRATGSQANSILEVLRDVPKVDRDGPYLSRRLEMVVQPRKSLKKEEYAILKPLWLQRVYVKLVQPMIQIAVAPTKPEHDNLIKFNYSLAVIGMAKHMEYVVFEQDVEQVLRVSIIVLQILQSGPDVEAALKIMSVIISEAPERAQSYLISIIKICINIFANRRTQQADPEWLPAEYVKPTERGDLIDARCAEHALGIIGRLPLLFEHRHLSPCASILERELSLALGHGVRQVRETARIARKAWRDMN